MNRARMLQLAEGTQAEAVERNYQYPEGYMTEKEWVGQYASSVQAFRYKWDELIDRRKYGRMDADEQEEYEKKLRKKAEKQLYRANDGDQYITISKETYLWAKNRGLPVLPER